MTKIQVLSISSERELARAYAVLRSVVPKGGLVILSGGLGSGKTAFVRAVCLALHSPDLVSSPTYALQNIYSAPDGQVVHHWDLYRLDVLPEELDEYRHKQGQFTFVEWGERFADLQQLADLIVQFEVVSEHARQIRFLLPEPS